LIACGWIGIDMGDPNADPSGKESALGVADARTKPSGKMGLHYFDYRGETVGWQSAGPDRRKEPNHAES
jgi:hypothetical protein